MAAAETGYLGVVGSNVPIDQLIKEDTRVTANLSNVSTEEIWNRIAELSVESQIGHKTPKAEDILLNIESNPSIGCKYNTTLSGEQHKRAHCFRSHIYDMI